MTLELALQMREGRKLAFTNGVFDILHAGHVKLLEEARKHGEALIVGINSDDSVKRLGKGPSRPINPLADRILVLEALKAVDGVVAFEEDTPEELIRILKPEVHVKGGDYVEAQLPEAKIVRSYGGDIVIVPLLEGRSTTRIEQELNKS